MALLASKPSACTRLRSKLANGPAHTAKRPPHSTPNARCRAASWASRVRGSRPVGLEEEQAVGDGQRPPTLVTSTSWPERSGALGRVAELGRDDETCRARSRPVAHCSWA